MAHQLLASDGAQNAQDYQGKSIQLLLEEKQERRGDGGLGHLGEDASVETSGALVSQDGFQAVNKTGVGRGARLLLDLHSCLKGD